MHVLVKVAISLRYVGVSKQHSCEHNILVVYICMQVEADTMYLYISKMARIACASSIHNYSFYKTQYVGMLHS